MTEAPHPDDFAAPRLLIEPDGVIRAEGYAAGHAVIVEDGRFSAVGPAAELRHRAGDCRRVALPGKILMPGFIDAHHHLTQSFGKALAFGEPSEIFRRVWVPLEGVLDEDLVNLSAKLGALESLRGGFTTVIDAGTRAEGSLEPLADAIGETGLRCVLALICNDRGGGPDRAAGEIVRRAEAHLARWPVGGIVHPSLAISIPEAASDDMLRDISSLCREAGAVFQTHANEHLVAVERSLVERGQRPVEHLAAAGALGPQALLAHATLLTPRELALLRDTGTAVAYNPVASAWKGNAVAPAGLMREMGIRFGIGTDATRSDGFRLVDAAETAQRLAFGLSAGDFSTGAGWTWLEHATSAGAEAVGLGGVTGEIAFGRAADFLIVDTEVPELCPSSDLVWELVRFGNRDQIVGVFVAGKLRLWRGWPTDWDARALMREVADRAASAVGSAPILKVHPDSASHRAASVAKGGKADP